MKNIIKIDLNKCDFVDMKGTIELTPRVNKYDIRQSLIPENNLESTR